MKLSTTGRRVLLGRRRRSQIAIQGQDQDHTCWWLQNGSNAWIGGLVCSKLGIKNDAGTLEKEYTVPQKPPLTVTATLTSDGICYTISVDATTMAGE